MFTKLWDFQVEQTGCDVRGRARMRLKFCEQNLIHYIVPHEERLSARPEGSQFGAQMGEVDGSLEPLDTGGEGFCSLWPAAFGPRGSWAPLEISQLAPLVLNSCTTPHERMTWPDSVRILLCWAVRFLFAN